MPHPLLKQGVVFIDTPGTNAYGFDAHQILAYDMVHKADAAIFTTQPRPVRKDEIDMLKRFIGENDKSVVKNFIWVQNMIDNFDSSLPISKRNNIQKEREEFKKKEIQRFKENKIHENMPIVQTSAKDAKVGRQCKNMYHLKVKNIPNFEDLVKKSGIVELEHAISHIILRNRGTVVLSGLIDEMKNLLKQLKQHIEMQQKGHSMRTKDKKQQINEMKMRISNVETYKLSLLESILYQIDGLLHKVESEFNAIADAFMWRDCQVKLSLFNKEILTCINANSIDEYKRKKIELEIQEAQTKVSQEFNRIAKSHLDKLTRELDQTLAGTNFEDLSFDSISLPEIPEKTVEERVRVEPGFFTKVANWFRSLFNLREEVRYETKYKYVKDFDAFRKKSKQFAEAIQESINKEIKIKRDTSYQYLKDTADNYIKNAKQSINALEKQLSKDNEKNEEDSRIEQNALKEIDEIIKKTELLKLEFENTLKQTQKEKEDRHSNLLQPDLEKGIKKFKEEVDKLQLTVSKWRNK